MLFFLSSKSVFFLNLSDNFLIHFYFYVYFLNSFFSGSCILLLHKHQCQPFSFFLFFLENISGWELVYDLLFIRLFPSPLSPPHQGAKHLTALIENHQLEWQQEERKRRRRWEKKHSRLSVFVLLCVCVWSVCVCYR